jgi:hypothetical protein
MRPNFKTALCLVGISLIAATPRLVQAPTPITPTDTNYDSRVGDQIRLPESLGVISQKELISGPNHNKAIVVVMDTGVESTHIDLVGQVILSTSYVLNTPVSFVHGTGMAGCIAALTNNGQFIASPGGLFPGRVQIADVHWANDGSDATAANLRKGLQQILDWKSQGYNIVAINCSFGFSQIEDNPNATKALLKQLKQNSIYCVSPEGGIIGSYVNDPECAVLTVSSLNETGTGFDQLSGGGFGGMVTGPGGILHQLVPIHTPTGDSSGVITTGGVSATTAIISGCLATVVQYGKTGGNVPKAVEALLETAVPFTDTNLSLSGHRIDLFASLQYDPDAPKITGITYNLGKKMVISGKNFGSDPKVTINGVDVTSAVNMNTESKIKLKGGIIPNSLHVGQNIIQVIGGADSSASNSFILTL